MKQADVTLHLCYDDIRYDGVTMKSKLRNYDEMYVIYDEYIIITLVVTYILHWYLQGYYIHATLEFKMYAHIFRHYILQKQWNKINKLTSVFLNFT